MFCWLKTEHWAVSHSCLQDHTAKYVRNHFKRTGGMPQVVLSDNGKKIKNDLCEQFGFEQNCTRTQQTLNDI